MYILIVLSKGKLWLAAEEEKFKRCSKNSRQKSDLLRLRFHQKTIAYLLRLFLPPFRLLYSPLFPVLVTTPLLLVAKSLLLPVLLVPLFALPLLPTHLFPVIVSWFGG